MSESWWAQVWLSAIETDVFADTSRAESGRRLARRESLPAPEIEPGGAVLRTADWVAQIGVSALDHDHWRVLRAAIGRDPMATAGLLAGDLPVEVSGLAAAEGIRLTPARDELVGECSCHEWHEPCSHVFALCFLVAERIEVDPWTLFLLRGHSRHDVVAEVRSIRARRRNPDGDPSAAPARSSTSSCRTVSARRAFAKPPAELPAARSIPRRAAPPLTLTVEPPVDAGLDLDDLRSLAADAAARAVALLNGDRFDAVSHVRGERRGDVTDPGDPSGFGLTEREDLARLACAALDRGRHRLVVMAERAGIPVAELEALALAWRVGGVAGVRIVDADDPSTENDDVAELVERALRVLGSEARVRGTTITVGPVRYRIDGAGEWWRFDADPDLGWLLAEFVGDLR